MTTLHQASWSGSYLHQLETQEVEEVVGDGDWDMDAEEAEYMANHQDIEEAEYYHIDDGVKYIALDTNVLIDQLARVQALYSVLSHSADLRVYLLIPTTVVNELDGLTSRTHLNARARSATSWLLHINKTRRETGEGPVRSQKWSERLDDSLCKGDDRILDCCLYFRQLGARVVLWTADRNLSLLAETNDMAALSPPPSVDSLGIVRQAFGTEISLQNVRPPAHMLPENGMDLDGSPSRSPPSQAASGRTSQPSLPPLSPSTGRRRPVPIISVSPVSSRRNGAVPTPPASTPVSPSTSTSTSARSSVSQAPRIAMRNPDHAMSSRPPIPSPFALEQLDLMARHIFDQLPPHTDYPSIMPYDPAKRPSENTLRSLETLRNKLTALQGNVQNVQGRANLFCAVSGLNTLCEFVRPTKRPKLAHEIRGDMERATGAFIALGVVLEREGVKRIMDDIKS